MCVCVFSRVCVCVSMCMCVVAVAAAAAVAVFCAWALVGKKIGTKCRILRTLASFGTVISDSIFG